MSQRFLRFLCVSALLFASARFANSQAEKGQISGQVTDPQGLVIPNAKLILDNLDTSAQLSTDADAAGHYAFAGLPAGRYRPNATFEVFTAFTSEMAPAPSQATYIR